MKPIEGIRSNAELARSNAKRAKETVELFLFISFSFTCPVGRSNTIKTRNQTAAYNWREVRARTSEKLGLGKWVNPLQESNLTVTKAKVKAILPNNALRLLLSRS